MFNAETEHETAFSVGTGKHDLVIRGEIISGAEFLVDWGTYKTISQSRRVQAAPECQQSLRIGNGNWLLVVDRDGHATR